MQYGSLAAPRPSHAHVDLRRAQPLGEAPTLRGRYELADQPARVVEPLQGVECSLVAVGALLRVGSGEALDGRVGQRARRGRP